MADDFSLGAKSSFMKRLSATLTVIFFAIAAFAQKTDFSGTWTLKDQKSISGILYGNGVPKQVKATQTKDDLTLETISANAQGEDVTTTESLSFNGKAFETTTSSKRKKSVTLKWAKDGKTFNRVSDLSQTVDTNKVEIRYTDTWSLEDGNLILQRKAENFLNGETWESKSVYEKI